MWFYTLVVCVFVVLTVFIAKLSDDGVYAFFAILALWFGGCFLAALLSWPVLGFTTGFLSGYSHGTRDGFLTKASVSGVIFKTNEAQIQVGTGDIAALQEPFKFSIRDPGVASLATELLGTAVRIEYKQWMIQPFRYGGTPYECISITPLELKK